MKNELKNELITGGLDVRRYNRLISEFDNSMLIRGYDKSWDNLMPVLKKIKIIQDEIHFDKRGNELINAIEKYVCLVQIKDAHMYVGEFVIWYNSLRDGGN